MVSSMGRSRSSGFLGGLSSAIEDAEHVVLAHDDVLGAINLSLAAGILAKQDTVAGFDVECNQLAILEPFAMADGNDLTFLRLFLRRIRDDDAVARGFLFLDPLHHDAVV